MTYGAESEFTICDDPSDMRPAFGLMLAALKEGAKVSKSETFRNLLVYSRLARLTRENEALERKLDANERRLRLLLKSFDEMKEELKNATKTKPIMLAPSALVRVWDNDLDERWNDV